MRRAEIVYTLYKGKFVNTSGNTTFNTCRKHPLR